MTIGGKGYWLVQCEVIQNVIGGGTCSRFRRLSLKRSEGPYGPEN